jgi:predicted site-specific integrase-resolvase
MKRKRRIKKSRSLAEYRVAKILKDLASGLDKAILQLKIQQLEMDNNLERMKLLMNYENKDN